MKKELPFHVHPQPDNTSCGPTCLFAVYQYLGENISHDEVIKEVSQFEKGGGTLAVILGQHALSKGHEVILYSYNLSMFDPSWSTLDNLGLMQKLQDQLLAKGKDKKFAMASKAYIKFLQHNGKIRLQPISSDLIRKYLMQDLPILTGLSATYLYWSRRTDAESNVSDDIAGSPEGHFVVLHGFDLGRNRVMVGDPYIKNPFDSQLHYTVGIDTLIASILLGIVTYDGNLLIIKPKQK